MSTFSKFLLNEKKAILDAWVQSVRNDSRIPQTSHASDPILKNDLPDLLDRIISCIASDTFEENNNSTVSLEIGSGTESASHGDSRIFAGYSIPAAVIELAHLRRIIFEICDENSVSYSKKERQLFNSVIDETMVTTAGAIADQRLNDLERISDAFISLDRDGTYTYINDAATEILNISKEEALGKNVWVLFPELQATGHGKAISKAFDTMQPMRVNQLYEPFEKWLDVFYYPDENGLSIFFRDVSGSIKHDKDLLEAKENAERANQAKSYFLAGMSHEIRTPLSAVIGFADLALNEENISPTMKDHLETIKRNSNHLHSLVSDLMDLSKIEAGQLDLEKSQIDIVQLVAEIIKLKEPFAKKKGIALKTRYDGLIPETVFTDPYKLKQILINLLGNSLKFTSSGTIELSVKLKGDFSHPLLAFEVKDTGIGIEPFNQEAIFDPFRRPKSQSSMRVQGTGLGLALSRDLARALDGELELAETKVGAGSIFRLSIDIGSMGGITLVEVPPETERKIAAPNPSKDLPKLSDHHLSGIKVLLAEDSPDICILVTTYLERSGAIAKTCGDGQSAVEAAKTNSFDVILMDIEMPIMDGNEAIREIRRSGIDTPIIALSAHALLEEKEKSRRAGCNKYVTKPLNSKTIVSAIQSVLPSDRI